MSECGLCGREASTYHRVHRNKKYCGTCYAYLFKKRECSVCGEIKRIYKYDSIAVCKACETRGKPCIRCGKQKYSIGKITDNGPVCNSCSIHFRSAPKCSCCGATTRSVSRRLPYNINEPICDKCLNKKIGVKCSHCHFTRPPFFYTLDKKPFCKPCSTKPDKACNVCRKILPGGFLKNTCSSCSCNNSLIKRLNLSSKALHPEIAKIYNDYGLWMEKTRDSGIASRKVISSFDIFVFLSQWFEKHNSLPSYDEYASHLTVAKTRKHLTVTYFLDETELIPLDHTRKLEIGNLDCIDRAYDRIPRSSPLFKYMDSYHEQIIEKYVSGKNTAHTARLTFGTAVSFLELGAQQGKKNPDIQLIRQYLWLHAGQRASLWGFITHLRKRHQLDLPSLDNKVYELVLERPYESTERTKQKLIALLRSGEFSQEDYTELALGYFHRVRLPDELRPIRRKIDLNNGEIKLSEYIFYLPENCSLRK